MAQQEDVLLDQGVRPSPTQSRSSSESFAAEKRAMTDRLAQSLGQDYLLKPLSLIDTATTVDELKVSDGQHQALLAAIQKNIELQRRLDAQRTQHSAAASASSTRSAGGAESRAEAEKKLLETQLEYNRLEKEYERLETLHKYFKEVDGMPPAFSSYLDPKDAFKDSGPFPQLPRELVEGFTRQQAPDQEIRELVSRFRKANLRQKLVLQRSERELDELKTRSPIADPTSAPLEVQVEALKAVKSSLVNLIETLLSKAGEDEAEGEGEARESPEKSRVGVDGGTDFDYKAHVAQFEQQWQRHIELRRQIEANATEIYRLRGSSSMADDDPVAQPEEQELLSSSAPLPETQAYLLTPYFNKLAALSREQKGMIQEKGYINSMIARHQQETRDRLHQFAQQSNLLSKYPPPPQSEQLQSSALIGGKRSAVEGQIRPWLFAADSAKIATFESVAESVDTGQVALDDAMQALEKIHQLQNKGNPHGSGGAGSGDQGSKDNQRSDGHSRTKSRKEVKKSIWSTLDGNLGLINE